MKAWIVAVNMGYGHERAAYPLRHLSPDGEVLIANDYAGIPREDRKRWNIGRRFYETISRARSVPFVGPLAFGIFDRFQRVPPLYPRRDLSTPNAGVRRAFRLIQEGWGMHLVGKLKEQALPLVSTFYTSAYMADYFGYPGDIYCVICDAAVSRTWAPLDPSRSRVNYLVPTSEVGERLQMYGVKAERIFLTGFPLPKENLGSEKFEVARRDLRERIASLDPLKIYTGLHRALLRDHLGAVPLRAARPLTVMFSIGGAGAQKDIVLQAMRSLVDTVRSGELRFVIAAGTTEEGKIYWLRNMLEMGVSRSTEVIWHSEAMSYFRDFNAALHTADILWTKPSELSFYAGLGIPVLMAPPIGSHEEWNRDWLLKTGAGIPQEDPRYADEWLFDYVRSGVFARAAVEGFLGIEKGGAFAIERIIAKHGVARR